MPSRSTTPGRKASKNTSAVAKRRSTVSMPAVCFRSIVIERRPRPIPGRIGLRCSLSFGWNVTVALDADDLGAHIGQSQ